MPNVAAVRLTYNPRVLWFDPHGVEFSKNDNLIVQTERGLEFGTADENLKEVTKEDLANLKCALKPVVRKATAEDVVAWKELQEKSAEALPVFKQVVAEQNLDMHPVAVEFLFDGDKAIFYFEAEDRVDFRELVRVLAAKFHVRIDMRQIGVRDEARIVGGLGHCGQELCCKRLGGEFNPVSIRMAKDQDLSLNPQKISGVCGRLMCCLRYEADTYKEFKTHCPKMNAMIATPEGDAKVIEVNVPRETVTLLSGDKRVKVPVASMDVDPKTGRPNAVSAEVFEECSENNNAVTTPTEALVSPIFTGTDKLADNARARRTGKSAGQGGSKRQGADTAAGEDEKKKSSRRRRRSGRSRSVEGAKQTGAPERNQGQGQGQGRGQGGQAQGGQAQSQRDRNDSRRSERGEGRNGRDAQRRNKQSSKRDGAQGQPQGQKQQRQDRGDRQDRADAPRQRSRSARRGQGGQTAAQQAESRAHSARPGQRSSGLAQAGVKKQTQVAHQPAHRVQQNGQQAPAAAKNGQGAPDQHRKSRRRSHKASGTDAK